MSDTKKQTGTWGENIAKRHLESHRYVIVWQNWTCREGEIDIIAYDNRMACLVFFEVKTRSSAMFALPETTIDARKKRSLERAIESYITQHSYRGAFRVDVIIVHKGAAKVRIHHIRDVNLE